MKLISIILTLTLTSCATVQEQKISSEDALQEIQKLTKAGKVDSLSDFFEKHGSLYPDGLMGEKSSKPALYLGSEKKLYTSDVVIRKFNDQNQMLNQIRIQCDKIPAASQKLKCLVSSNTPCSNARDVGCSLKEDKVNGLGQGTFSISGISSVGDFMPFATGENLEWYIKAVETSLAKTNLNPNNGQDSTKSISQFNLDSVQENENNWESFCRAKGIKAVFKAHVEPINKFDSSSIFSFVSVVQQHCIGKQFADRFKYLNYCPGNRNRTCGVIQGLDKSVRSSQLVTNQFLAFTSYTTGSNLTGLGEDKLAVLKIISDSEITKAGLR